MADSSSHSSSEHKIYACRTIVRHGTSLHFCGPLESLFNGVGSVRPRAVAQAAKAMLCNCKERVEVRVLVRSDEVGIRSRGRHPTPLR